ncbi:hypothetical protein NKJ35_23850 [Mesorhizobium sp. M0136]|uniref:hypothetical protein n=1 Tax=Mesorhizobium sp. M0136 TaxID=2956890 RepID=UPI00333A34DE
MGELVETELCTVTSKPLPSVLAPAGKSTSAAVNSALLARKMAAREFREARASSDPFRHRGLRLAPLGTSAVDCVKTKKPPARSSRPGFRERVWT